MDNMADKALKTVIQDVIDNGIVEHETAPTVQRHTASCCNVSE